MSKHPFIGEISRGGLADPSVILQPSVTRNNHKTFLHPNTACPSVPGTFQRGC